MIIERLNYISISIIIDITKKDGHFTITRLPKYNELHCLF